MATTELTERVLNTIAENQRIPRERVTENSTFEELGIDSMDGVSILFALETEFEIVIPDDAVREIRTIRGMIDGVEQLVAAKAASTQQAQ